MRRKNKSQASKTNSEFVKSLLSSSSELKLISDKEKIITQQVSIMEQHAHKSMSVLQDAKELVELVGKCLKSGLYSKHFNQLNLFSRRVRLYADITRNILPPFLNLNPNLFLTENEDTYERLVRDEAEYARASTLGLVQKQPTRQGPPNYMDVARFNFDEFVTMSDAEQSDNFAVVAIALSLVGVTVLMLSKGRPPQPQLSSEALLSLLQSRLSETDWRLPSVDVIFSYKLNHHLAEKLNKPIVEEPHIRSHALRMRFVRALCSVEDPTPFFKEAHKEMSSYVEQCIAHHEMLLKLIQEFLNAGQPLKDEDDKR